jgi:acetylcholinesterase
MLIKTFNPQIGHHVMRNTPEAPIFHKAIIESGGTTARATYAPTHHLHELQFQEFITILGCDKVPVSETITCLRSHNQDDITQASFTIWQKYDASIRWPFQPVVDGEGGMIPLPPIDTLRSGNWFKLPLLTGFNTNEGAMFVPKQLSTNEQFVDFFQTLLPGLSEDDIKKLQEVYPDPVADPTSKFVETRKGIGLGPQFNRTEEAYGQFAYISPVRQTLKYAAQGGSRSYLYHFAVNSTVKGGADHGSHIGFPTYNPAIRDSSSTLENIASSMHAYWTSFITTGDPNKVKGRAPDRPVWPAYMEKIGIEKGKMLVFGEGNDELAGGKHEGVPVQVKVAIYMEKEYEFWSTRTKKFEG